MDSGLRDQVVLITGASGGIGRATARLAAAEGARLVLHAHRNLEAASRLADEVTSPALAIGADLRDASAVDSMFERAIDSFGRIDVVVANAGIWPAEATPLHEMSLERWRETIETDLTSVFLTCRAFLRGVAARPREAASIVLVGSTAAIFGEADHADYAAAKAGLVYGLTRSLKNEIARLAPRGRVNAVCPGWTDTPMAAAGLAHPGLVSRVFATTPLEKIATPEDVAAAIVWLASDALAGHVTGAIIPVAGGMEGRLLRDPSPAANQ
ncbi:MAG: SDR family NAD(P)-dependent oxidoreductase [Planctomycetota bacterium]|jgi:3-oxoacyl-[acyl-carrier protein] reductase